MLFLQKLLKNEFNHNLTIEEAKKHSLAVCSKLDDLCRELNIDYIPFEDTKFNLIYKHPDYIYLKRLLEEYKYIKNLSLPDKDYE